MIFSNHKVETGQVAGFLCLMKLPAYKRAGSIFQWKPQPFPESQERPNSRPLLIPDATLIRY